jgi:translation initiation factor 4G
VAQEKVAVDIGISSAPERAPQKRKLQLLPRTRPVRKEPKVSASVSESSSDVKATTEGGTPAPAVALEQIKSKIVEDVKEFFSTRMINLAESYFSGLPAEHRHRLVDALVMASIEMKEPDVKLVGDLFVRVREKDLCSPAAFEEGFIELADLLDDLAAMVIPKAWSYFAILLKGSGLDRDKERYARIAEKTTDPDRLNQLL